MFGNTGWLELLILVLVGAGVVFGRRGALAMSGPVLALRKFEVNDDDAPVAIVIEGRPSGLIGWLLSTVGLDTRTTLTVTDGQVSFRAASLSGEINHLVPTTTVSSTHCGYSQPIWLLIVGGTILLLSILAALNGAGSALIGGVFLAGICGVIYLLQRKIAITVETVGGIIMGLSFKPSIIESVSINLPRALEAVDRINTIVVAKSHGAVV